MDKKIKNLVNLIRKGLKTERVFEDPQSWGAVDVDGACGANAVGLALVGKSDVDAAMKLTQEVFDEAGSGSYSKREQVARELGLDGLKQLETLALLNRRYNVEDLMKKLEADDITIR